MSHFARVCGAAATASALVLVGCPGGRTDGPVTFHGNGDPAAGPAANGPTGSTASSPPSASVSAALHGGGAPLGVTGTQLLVGLGARGQGYVEAKEIPAGGPLNAAWPRVNWTAYNTSAVPPGASTRPAVGDIDGDGKDELIVGLGPNGGGFAWVFDDASTGFAELGTVRVAWTAYVTSGDAPIHPACVDLDGDGTDEVVLGLGKNGQGYVQVLRYSNGTFSPMAGMPNGYGFVRVSFSTYNASGDAPTYPAGGDVDGDGADELAIGLGANGKGYVQLWKYNGAALVTYPGAPLVPGFVRVPWTAYNSTNNAPTYPALGDLDADGKADLAIGLGATGGAYTLLMRSTGATFVPMPNTPVNGGWVRVPWRQYYDSGSAPTHPAIGDVTNDGQDDLVIGLGGNGVGWVHAVRGVTFDAVPGWPSAGWTRVTWYDYNNLSSTDGPTYPAVMTDREGAALDYGETRFTGTLASPAARTILCALNKDTGLVREAVVSGAEFSIDVPAGSFYYLIAIDDDDLSSTRTGVDTIRGVIDGGLAAAPGGTLFGTTPGATFDLGLVSSSGPILSCANPTASLTDTDTDGSVDSADADPDGDGHAGLGTLRTDADQDGLPDWIEADADGDFTVNALDGPLTGAAATASSDDDGDGTPDLEDHDRDNDGVANADDGDVDGDGAPETAIALTDLGREALTARQIEVADGLFAAALQRDPGYAKGHFWRAMTRMALVVERRAPGGQESFTDSNGNGVHDVGEPFNDANGNGAYDRPRLSDLLDLAGQPEVGRTQSFSEPFVDGSNGFPANGVYDHDPFVDANGDGVFNTGEPFTDSNVNGFRDDGEPFDDVDGNGAWQAGEPFADLDNDGARDPGEAWVDVDGDGTYDAPDFYNSLFMGDANGNGVCDGEDFTDLDGDGKRDDTWELVERDAHDLEGGVRGLLLPSAFPNQELVSQWIESEVLPELEAVAAHLSVADVGGFATTVSAAERGGEPFTDSNGNLAYDDAEPFGDFNGNGTRDQGDPFTDSDGDGVRDFEEQWYGDYNNNGVPDPDEPFVDANGNGYCDREWNDINRNNLVDQAEPFTDQNGNGFYDVGEPFTDELRHNGQWDSGESFTDVNGSGFYEYPEPFTDTPQQNGFYDGNNEWVDFNGNSQVDNESFTDTERNDGNWNDEYFLDVNGNGAYDNGEPFNDWNQSGAYEGPEPFTDQNGNGLYDNGEPFTDTLRKDGNWNAAEFDDANGNDVRDPAEPFTDADGNGSYTPPEFYVDFNSNGQWDPAEPFTDTNGNGEYDDGLRGDGLLIEIDQADVKVLRAGVRAIMGALRLYRAHHLAVDAPDLAVTWEGVDLQADVIDAYPALLTQRPGAASLLAAARTDLDGAMADFSAGSALAEAEVDPQDDDLYVVKDPGDPAPEVNEDVKNEENLRATLAQLRQALFAEQQVDDQWYLQQDTYTDTDGDGYWDEGEPYQDANGNGQFDVGEPFFDLNSSGTYDGPEPITLDHNGNGEVDQNPTDGGRRMNYSLLFTGALNLRDYLPTVGSVFGHADPDDRDHLLDAASVAPLDLTLGGTLPDQTDTEFLRFVKKYGDFVGFFTPAGGTLTVPPDNRRRPWQDGDFVVADATASGADMLLVYVFEAFDGAGADVRIHTTAGSVFTVENQVPIFVTPYVYASSNGTSTIDLDLATFAEPFTDANGNGQFDPGESFSDSLDPNGVRDPSVRTLWRVQLRVPAGSSASIDAIEVLH